MVNLTVNGVSYNYPELTDEGWGPDATNWAVAITQGVLTKAGGLFSLTADIDFGPNFGLKSVYYKSRSTNIALSGQIRLANSDLIDFRNSTNTADLNFGPGSTDAVPAWNGIDLVNLSSVQTLTNKTITGGTISGGTFNSPTINTPTVNGGTFSSPTISNPTITGLTTLVNLTTTGNTTIGDASSDTLTINADVTSSIIPGTTNTYDLGSSANLWRNVYANQVGLANGTASNPSLFFINSPNLGIYRDSGSSMTLVASGGPILQVTVGSMIPFVPFVGASGTVSAPEYSFGSDTATGIYRSAASTVGIATNGSLAFEFNSGINTSYKPLRINSGQTLILNNPANTFSTNIKAGTNLADYTITLPAAAPATNTFLKYNGSAYIWSLESFSGDINNGGNTFGAPITIGTNDNFALTLIQNGASQLRLNGTTISTPTSVLQAIDGSASVPTYSFNTSQTTGMYLVSNNQLGFSTNSTQQLSIDTNRIQSALQFRAPDTGYVFSNSNSTGMQLGSGNSLQLVQAGSTQLRLNGSTVSALVAIFGVDGSATNPSYAFSNAQTSGLYKSSTGGLGFTSNGTAAGDIGTTQAWTIGGAASTVTHTINAASISLVNASGNSVTEDTIQQTSLVNNTVAGLVFQNATASNNSFVIEYSIVRGTNFETGRILMITDGTTVQISPDSITIGDVGVTFTSQVSGANAQLLYTTTNTGTAGTMRFSVRRWKAN